MVTSSPGVAVLGKRLEVENFHQGSTLLLCKRKLNYVIISPGYFVHDLNVHLYFAEKAESIVFYQSARCCSSAKRGLYKAAVSGQEN